MGKWKKGGELQFGLRHKDSCAKKDHPDAGMSAGRRAWFEGNLCKPVPSCRLSIICEEIGIGSVATHHMVTTYP